MLYGKLKISRLTWAAIVFCSLLRFEAQASSITETIVPDHLVVQSAGYLGFVAGGISYDALPWWELGLFLGHTPKRLGGRDFTTIAWKNHFSFLQLWPGAKGQTDFYVGLSLLYGHSQDLFLELPDKYPNRYYPPSALRYLASLGGSLALGEQSGIRLELAYHDVELLTYYHNYGWLPFRSLGSWALGYYYTL